MQGYRAPVRGFFMSRVIVFIDGFNVYHALNDVNKQGLSPYRKYKWLNYCELSKLFLSASDVITDIYYFSAIFHLDPEKAKRHWLYINVLRDTGVKYVLGRFTPETNICPLCKKVFQVLKEKRTNVNIAVHMVKLAYEDAYDKAILLSGDSDLIPAIEVIRNSRPQIRIEIVIPIGRSGKALSHAVYKTHFMNEDHLVKRQLPDPYVLKNGVVIDCPTTWK